VAHTLTTYFFLCYLYTATITNDAFVANTFVFSTVAFVILDGTKNAFAEESAHFGLVAAVVDGFRLGNLPKTTAKYVFR